MKATELRIGNILLIDGKEEPVWALHEDGVNGICTDSASGSYEFPKSVEPIPFSTDFLAKYPCKGHWNESSYEFQGFRLTYKQVDGWRISVITDNGFPHKICRLKYVHEFQNAYFMLMGEELFNQR